MVDINWDSFKEKIPESLWGLVENDFNAWKAEIEPTLADKPNEYEPYKPALEGLTPEQLIQARKFAEWYERDQEGFISQIAQHMGYDLQKPGSNPGNPADEDEDEDLKNLPPALKKQLDQLTTLVAQQGTFLTKQAELTKEQKQAEEFQTYLSGLKDQHKEIWSDEVERFVVARIASGDSADNALKDLKNLMGPKTSVPTPPPNPNDPLAMLANQIDSGGQQSPGDSAPTVIGAGDLPSNKRSITDLSDNETNNLVAEIARKFQEQGS